MGRFRSGSEVLMQLRRPYICATAIAAASIFAFPPNNAGRQKSDTAALFAKFKEPTTTDLAARQLLALAKKDPGAHEFVVSRLPEVIENQSPRQVWRNAVLLAGGLKAANAVPSLIKVMPQSPYGSSVITGFADAYSLQGDIVGKALCDIGDASIPELEKLLSNSEKSTRLRAARILWNINSPNSRRVLHAALKSESDPALVIFAKEK